MVPALPARPLRRQRAPGDRRLQRRGDNVDKWVADAGGPGQPSTATRTSRSRRRAPTSRASRRRRPSTARTTRRARHPLSRSGWLHAPGFLTGVPQIGYGSHYAPATRSPIRNVHLALGTCRERQRGRLRRRHDERHRGRRRQCAGVCGRRRRLLAARGDRPGERELRGRHDQRAERALRADDRRAAARTRTRRGTSTSARPRSRTAATLDIVGESTKDTIVDAERHRPRLPHVRRQQRNATDVDISDLTVTGGFTFEEHGGGILNEAFDTLTLLRVRGHPQLGVRRRRRDPERRRTRSCSRARSTATQRPGAGGGICSTGELNVEDSTVNDNARRHHLPGLRRRRRRHPRRSRGATASRSSSDARRRVSRASRRAGHQPGRHRARPDDREHARSMATTLYGFGAGGGVAVDERGRARC